MSNNLPEKLRALAQKKGEKLTARDVAVLIQAANKLDRDDESRLRVATINRDQMLEYIDTKARLNGLLETLEAALLEARGNDEH